MWGRRKRRNEAQPKAIGPLRDAIRDARIEAAERTGVVVDLHDAEIARLELLNEELQPVFADVPDTVDLFDPGISRGDVPRLWIDAVAHVAMGRDKRLYRFVQDSRHGRRILAESPASREIAEAVTRYIARRLIERERLLAGDEFAPLSARAPAPRRSRWLVLGIFMLGAVTCLACLSAAAWLGASVLPSP
jgi:hypothetical protein